jgi:glycosyltransferase involved in cell wall biosynthesis
MGGQEPRRRVAGSERASQGKKREEGSGVSIIVPTRDRPRALERCLLALAHQRSIEIAEIVVVDDGSREPESIAAIAARIPNARVVRIDGQGPAAARNAGVRATRGEFVLFTDDDCEPEPEWASRIVAALREPGVDAVGGRTVPAYADPYLIASETISDYLVAHMPFLGSGNLGCQRRLALIESFDEDFPDAAGEDRAWCERLVAGDRRLVYEPEAVVRHYANAGLRLFWKRHYRYGRAASRLARRRSRRRMSQPPRFYLGLLATGFRAGPRIGALVCLAQIATLAGVLRERRRVG